MKLTAFLTVALAAIAIAIPAERDHKADNKKVDHIDGYKKPGSHIDHKFDATKPNYNHKHGNKHNKAGIWKRDPQGLAEEAIGLLPVRNPSATALGPNIPTISLPAPVAPATSALGSTFGCTLNGSSRSSSSECCSNNCSPLDVLDESLQPARQMLCGPECRVNRAPCSSSSDCCSNFCAGTEAEGRTCAPLPIAGIATPLALLPAPDAVTWALHAFSGPTAAALTAVTRLPTAASAQIQIIIPLSVSRQSFSYGCPRPLM
ncbi:hypothetical protein HDV00_010852 [Rhizophlyctis rosea]|nr:hypothetical protein HDV00_010852 [Rhizophlyctis rosea]